MEVSGVGSDDTVVEIGAGDGRLTAILAERVRKVIAIELDVDFVKGLLQSFRSVRNVEIVHEDALRYDYSVIGPFRVVSNIPYYITTPLIFRLLEEKDLLSMTLTVQKEVAERIVASPGSKAYGVLSIMVQYIAKPEIKFFIPRGAFRPRPKVDSAVVHLRIGRDLPKAKDEVLFRRIVRTAFSSRRKTLLNSLKALAKGGEITVKDLKGILERCNIDPNRRPETFSIEEFIRLSDEVTVRWRGNS